MAFATKSQLLLVGLLIAAFTLEAHAARRRKGGPRNKSTKKTDYSSFGCATDTEVTKNIKDLWSHVKFLSQPVEVHVHNDDDSLMCDDYFGCTHKFDYERRNASHSHGSHGHAHGAHGHAHGSHGHAHRSHGHAHGSHKPGSHGHAHGSKAPAGGPKSPSYRDSHIHIHMNVNTNDNCKMVSYRPKDEFVYARCDMMPAEVAGTVGGSILMRQKPHGILETKLRLNGFSGPSEGIKDGQHDFFFDLHEMADFSDRCASFGAHSHVHHSDGGFDHEHDHKHESDHHHNHDHHDGHNHSVHDHHAHESDWGNVIIDADGVANMEVNCTHHELYGPESMFGHGIVLHDKDDVSVACCSITYANINDETWETL